MTNRKTGTPTTDPKSKPPKKAKKTDVTAESHPRVVAAADHYRARSFYLPTDGGSLRTLHAALDGPLPQPISIDGGEVLVHGFVYDSNPSDLDRPVRLVLGADEAVDLGRALVTHGEWVNERNRKEAT